MRHDLRTFTSSVRHAHPKEIQTTLLSNRNCSLKAYIGTFSLLMRKTHSSAKHHKLNFRKQDAKKFGIISHCPSCCCKILRKNIEAICFHARNILFYEIRCFIVEHLGNAKQNMPLACLLYVRNDNVQPRSPMQSLGRANIYTPQLQFLLHSQQNAGAPSLCWDNPKVTIKREAQLWGKKPLLSTQRWLNQTALRYFINYLI